MTATIKKPETGFESTEPASTAWLRHRVLPWQFFHLLGSVGWNVAGVVLVSQGLQPLGPTASLLVTAVLLLLGAGLWVGLSRMRPLYLTLSILLGVGALVAVMQAFTGKASLWPSALWRWAGAGLNLTGFLANFLGVATALFRRDASKALSPQSHKTGDA